MALAAATGYPADARALEPTQVLLVQKDGILALLKRQPELALRMLGSMSSHLRVLVGQLEDLTLKDVETRLANWLVKRCPNPQSEAPVKIELTMTKRVLAAELGTVSETFSRTLAKFREQKLDCRQRQNYHGAFAGEIERVAAAQFERIRIRPSFNADDMKQTLASNFSLPATLRQKQ